MSDPDSQTMPPGRNSKEPVIAALACSAGALCLSALALVFATGVFEGRAVSSDFESQARAYFLAQPETVANAITQMEERRKTAEASELTRILADRYDAIFNDPAAPVGGNAEGEMTVVELFDYNCPYCRKAAPILDQLAETDREVRVVFKEFPILGPGSTFAARAALASMKLGKYLAFHNAMIGSRAAITESSAIEIAATTGRDVERLKQDMQDPAIGAAVMGNIELANAQRIGGTPSFVSGKQITRGLVDLDTMNELVAAERRG
jgi:protein-disulfide isomerase